MNISSVVLQGFYDGISGQREHLNIARASNVNLVRLVSPQPIVAIITVYLHSYRHQQ